MLLHSRALGFGMAFAIAQRQPTIRTSLLRGLIVLGARFTPRLACGFLSSRTRSTVWLTANDRLHRVGPLGLLGHHRGLGAEPPVRTLGRRPQIDPALQR